MGVLLTENWRDFINENGYKIRNEFKRKWGIVATPTSPTVDYLSNDDENAIIVHEGVTVGRIWFNYGDNCIEYEIFNKD